MKLFAALLMLAVGVVIVATLLLSACEDDWCFLFTWQKIQHTYNFQDCLNRGFPVMESFPRQCRAGDTLFVEDVSGLE